MKKIVMICIALLTFGFVQSQTDQKAKQKPKTEKSKAKQSEVKKKKPTGGRHDPAASGSGMTVEPKDRPKLDEIRDTSATPTRRTP